MLSAQLNFNRFSPYFQFHLDMNAMNSVWFILQRALMFQKLVYPYYIGEKYTSC